ncbi:MAG: copper-binding protein, partial [Variovorax sp.]|nr:copper-binding protein [Variovorax sp.]
ERIGKDEVTISHGPIASLQWGPMTMPFKLPSGGMPGDVKVGERVVFDVRQRGDGGFEIVTISPNGTMKLPSTPAGAKR